MVPDVDGFPIESSEVVSTAAYLIRILGANAGTSRQRQNDLGIGCLLQPGSVRACGWQWWGMGASASPQYHKLGFEVGYRYVTYRITSQSKTQKLCPLNFPRGCNRAVTRSRLRVHVVANSNAPFQQRRGLEARCKAENLTRRHERAPQPAKQQLPEPFLRCPDPQP